MPQSKSNVAIESSNLPTCIKAWVFHNFLPLFTIVTVRCKMFSIGGGGASKETIDPVDKEEYIDYDNLTDVES